MRNYVGKAIRVVIGIIAGVIMPLVIIIMKKKRIKLIWGPIPILSNKYWSEAMRQVGYQSLTYMNGLYVINQRADFDKYLISNGFMGGFLLRTHISHYIAFLHCIRYASVIHIPISGGFLGGTVLESVEAELLHLAGIKIVVLPYGGDFYRYSKVLDKCFTAALLESYHSKSRQEMEINRRVAYWTKNADCMICGFQLDGMGRWDVNVAQFVVIDTTTLQMKRVWSNSDGQNGSVKIIHTPNHRGFKGTEFLINAVEELKQEGLKIELILVEKKSNIEVLFLLQQADILAEQFVFTGYALSAIEGMATGLPVLSNLDNEDYTRVFRRYSYLNECPILSTTPETLKDNLRLLVTHPELREVLGKAGRKYVEKYHSYKAAQYLFGNVYDKILYGKDVDLMNLFHPLRSEYVKQNHIVHPLVENKLPKDYFDVDDQDAF